MIKKEFAKGTEAVNAKSGVAGVVSKAERLKTANSNFLLGKLSKAFKKAEINLEDAIGQEQRS